MTNPETIASGTVVSIHYTLRLEDGTVIESSDETLDYLHGHDNIVPGLEEALEGAQAGASVNVIVPPEKAYGEHMDDGVQQADRSQFPGDVDLQPGMQFLTETEDGQQIPGMVTAIEGDTVTVDFNHPLAGKTLKFDVEVVGIRASTEEEREHGHPHSEGGHEGCDHD